MISRDTIFALATGALPSGIAIVRVSGPGAEYALDALCGGAPATRLMTMKAVREEDGTIIDNGLVVFFAGPASFTGEDVAELHLHGGKAVVKSVLRRLSELDGLRQGEAGEFTRRAFLNGKMDLTGAEALGDLIAAETETQRRFALANAGGLQAALYGGWREKILHARAMIEAELDFADEADVGEAASDAAWPELRSLADEIGAHLASHHRAEIIQDGFRVVIVGAPNAGKSSLLNALAQREAAIVTEEAGTTRDLIDVSLNLDGVKVVVTDTAGLREQAGRVEAIGMEKARKRAAGADLVLLLRDLSDPLEIEDRFEGVTVWRIGTKVDLVSTERRAGRPQDDHRISVRSGEGMETLIGALAHTALEAASTTGILPSKARHVNLLITCKEHLVRALGNAGALEMRAEELRLASDALGRIVGAVDVEDLLGAIFSSFCIGK
ncbi:MAG: tRNA uridine-5-carboxymethylaminomethyl(34) synthesis GTPase MnmE [Rhizobiaceae bacterium]